MFKNQANRFNCERNLKDAIEHIRVARLYIEPNDLDYQRFNNIYDNLQFLIETIKDAEYAAIDLAKHDS